MSRTARGNEAAGAAEPAEPAADPADAEHGGPPTLPVAPIAPLPPPPELPPDPDAEDGDGAGRPAETKPSRRERRQAKKQAIRDAKAAAPKLRLRDRLIPKTVLGLAMLILSAAVGAAFSGAVLFSYYQYRLQKTDDRVNSFITGYRQQFDKASADVAAQGAAAKAAIDQQLAPLRQLQASSDTLQALVRKTAPALWFVHTLDANGQPSVGTAFAVVSDTAQTLLITSLNTVLAATHKPAPDLFVRQGNTDVKVTVWTWDERYDLALIVLPKGGLPVLHPSSANPPAAIGDRIFAVSGLGALGASATDGIVTDVSATGVQHTAPIGPAFQGAPLVDATGDVIAIASRSYAPLNFSSDTVWFAPFVQAACAKILQCPAGSFGGSAGAARSG